MRQACLRVLKNGSDPRHAPLLTCAERATEAYSAMRRALYRPDVGLFLEDAGPSPTFAYLWPFSQALAAAIDVALLGNAEARSDVTRLLEGLEAYWHGSFLQASAYDSAVRAPWGPGGDVFYDDNAWVGLDLLRAERIADKESLLKRAASVFQLAISGWDRDPSHPAPGGVFWVRAAWNRDRGTVCAAPNAQVGLHLYEMGRHGASLEWPQEMVGWVKKSLRHPSGLYWDKVLPDGTIDETFWSYNQGTMVGAEVLLHRLTGDAPAHASARTTAEAALAHYGPGDGDGYWNQPIAFNAIFFRNLLAAENEPWVGAARQAASAYAERLWACPEHDRASGLFRSGAGAPTLLDQAGVIQVLCALASCEP